MTQTPVHLRIFLGLVWLSCLGMLVSTYGWDYHHDTPLLNFAATMMVEHDWLPYRDIFETTMPATFLFHYMVIALGLEGNLPFILLGIAAFILLSSLGFLVLHKFSPIGAWCFAPFYMAVMLSFGAEALLQREILGLIPLSLALWLVSGATSQNHNLRQGLIGLLLGIACLIKPQFALGAPVMVIAAASLATPQFRITTLFKGILISGIGFAIPLSFTAYFMWTNGMLEQFIFILTEYTPLYIQQTRTHAFIAPELRAKYIWEHWMFFGGTWTVLPGILLLVILLAFQFRTIDRAARILFAAISVLCLIYGLMPIASGQFWPYHYFTFMFFGVLCTCCAFYFLNKGAFVPKLIKFGLIVLTFMGQTPRFLDSERLRKSADNRLVRIHQMKDALADYLPKGARVQPLDWTSGSLHAMMLNRNRLATRFMYNFHFAHTVSHPVNAGLRSTLMRELSQNPPEGLLIGLKSTKVHGLDVSYDFPELEAFKSSNYELVTETDWFQLYRRGDLGS